MRLDYDHYNKTNYTQDKRASLNIESNVFSSSTAKTDPISATLTPSPKLATFNKSDKPFKVDMASFQEQLSKLALDRPSTGLIPKAPEGSKKAWANLVMSSRESTTTSKDD